MRETDPTYAAVHWQRGKLYYTRHGSLIRRNWRSATLTIAVLLHHYWLNIDVGNLFAASHRYGGSQRH